VLSLSNGETTHLLLEVIFQGYHLVLCEQHDVLILQPGRRWIRTSQC